MQPVVPILTAQVFKRLIDARNAGLLVVDCSLDLQRTIERVALTSAAWTWRDHQFPYLEQPSNRTIYHWVDDRFEIASRYASSLIKLVPTDWGPPTFEIDGIKMLPTAHVSPYDDAERKVALIRPRDKKILDTCGGLGYFAAWCLAGGAAHVLSYEKNADVIWLRSLNPWSPSAADSLTLIHADVTERVAGLASNSLDAILHDPPRFGTAGELYSQAFYNELSRVLNRRGRLFHYTGTPNKLTSRRDVAVEVANRLTAAGFDTRRDGDGLLAVKN